METVLGHWLQSVLVNSSDIEAGALAGIAEGAVSLMDKQGDQPDIHPDSLAAKVDGPPAVRRLLGTVTICESPQAAMTQRVNLKGNASVVTPEGIWMGRDWLRVARGLDDQAGVLQRERDINRQKSTCP